MKTFLYIVAVLFSLAFCTVIYFVVNNMRANKEKDALEE